MSGTPEHRSGHRPILRWDSDQRRWHVLETPFALGDLGNRTATRGWTRAVAADGRGGAWIVTEPSQPLNAARTRWGGLLDPPSFYYRYTDHAPEQVFTDSPHPIR